jgi:hypothetical protein
MTSLLELRFNLEAPTTISGFTSMPSDCLKVPEKNGNFTIGSPGGVAAGGLAGFRRGGSRGWGTEVGKSFVAHLGAVLRGWRWRGRSRRGSPAALGSGHRGGGKSSDEPGRVRAMRGRGGVHGVLGSGEDGWTAMEGQRGRASPSGPYGGRRRREVVGGEEQVRPGKSSERPLLIVDKRSRPASTCAPALTRRTACPLTGARREPAADRWVTSSATGGED